MKVCIIIFLFLTACKQVVYCNPDYCIQEGETLEQIGVSF